MAEKFTDQIDNVQDLLTKHPNIGMKTGRLRSVRKIVIVPHYTLYYSYLNNIVWILSVLDNREKSQSI